MGCKTSKTIKENERKAVEGETNTITQQMSEREPRKAGFVNHIRGINHLEPAKPVGVAPDPRLTCCRNFSRVVGAAGPSALKKGLIGSCD